MSLILMMIYWLVLPVFGLCLAQWLFRRAQTTSGKGLVVIGGVGALAWFLWQAVGEKMWLDHQVREMCAKDGGVKVYETVRLPKEKFDKYGKVVIPFKQHAKPEDKYYYETDTHYYRSGDPSMSRSHFRIVRRSDGKVLGESIFYGRGGGDLPGPWHGSGFTCPDPTQSPGLETLIFEGDNK